MVPLGKYCTLLSSVPITRLWVSDDRLGISTLRKVLCHISPLTMWYLYNIRLSCSAVSEKATLCLNKVETKSVYDEQMK